jgi:hypothetical protein
MPDNGGPACWRFIIIWLVKVTQVRTASLKIVEAGSTKACHEFL